MKSVENTLIEISNNFNNLSNNYSYEIKDVSDIIIQSLNNGKKIMFCGNGGSAADSQHLSAELVGRYQKKRKADCLKNKKKNTTSNYALGSKNGNLNKAANNLCNILRKIKKNKYSSLAGGKIPNKGLGKTINDRLIRASKF